MTEELLGLSAGQAAASVRAGEISAESYCAALQDQAGRVSSLNIFISRNPSLAEQGRAVDLARARGDALGLLAGVPLLIKDNIDIEGFVTTAGTPALEAWRPATNAPVAAALLGAGALVMGKANMQELALGITSNNARFGPVRNPYDPRLIAGGSSGGTGAGVAARTAPAGLGSDTAGSIRIPAALCGVAGLRPSMGRWSQAGIAPLSHSRDTAGPMARTVADLALLDALVAGGDDAPAAAAPRLGAPASHFWEDLDPGTARACADALDRLAQAGAEIVPVDVAQIVAVAETIGRALTIHEVIPDLRAYLSGRSPSVEQLIARIASPDVAAAMDLAVRGMVDEATYLHARDVLQPQLKALYRDLFLATGVDALVFPATPLPARPVGQDRVVEINGRLADTRSVYLRNTEHAALAGLPGLVLPAGLTGQGLPVGLEFDGPYGADRELLAIGGWAEPVLGQIAPPAL